MFMHVCTSVYMHTTLCAGVRRQLQELVLSFHQVSCRDNVLVMRAAVIIH